MYRTIGLLALCTGMLVYLGCGGDEGPTEKGEARSGSLFIYNDVTEPDPRGYSTDLAVTVTFLGEDRIPLDETVLPGKVWVSAELDGGTRLRVELTMSVDGVRPTTKEVTIDGLVRLRVTGYSPQYGGGDNLYVELS